MGLNIVRKQKLKDALSKKPYIFVFISTFIIYILLNLWINQVLVTNIFSSLATWFLVPFFLLNFLIVPFLVGLTISLVVMKFKDASFVAKRKAKGGGTFALIGTFFGVLGGACPGCFVGLFPAVLGIFGVTATLSVLPLFGLEIQIFSSILLIVAIMLLTRETVCKVDFKK